MEKQVETWGDLDKNKIFGMTWKGIGGQGKTYRNKEICVKTWQHNGRYRNIYKQI